jgi:hypothetical protein
MEPFPGGRTTTGEPRAVRHGRVKPDGPGPPAGRIQRDSAGTSGFHPNRSGHGPLANLSVLPGDCGTDVPMRASMACRIGSGSVAHAATTWASSGRLLLPVLLPARPKEQKRLKYRPDLKCRTALLKRDRSRPNKVAWCDRSAHLGPHPRVRPRRGRYLVAIGRSGRGRGGARRGGRWSTRPRCWPSCGRGRDGASDAVVPSGTAVSLSPSGALADRSKGRPGYAPASPPPPWSAGRQRPPAWLMAAYTS